ncbi:MAG: hypothetical protein U0573_02000 [Phycisphaerales bacterium]|nr:hypothetical protein [Planctomycetota bacterium]
MKSGLRAAIGFVAGLGFLASLALGQSAQTLPPAFDAVAGTSGNSLPIANYSEGTIQVMYGADQLTGIPAGSIITGMQLRLRNVDGPFPSVAYTASRYDVRLASSSLTPATMSSTFATNMTGAVLVRSGALNVAANAYPGTGNPRAWGPVVAFTTPFVYPGGPLVIEWRVVSPSSTFAAYTDLVNTGTANRYMETDNDANATTATTRPPSAGGPIVRLTFAPPALDLAKGVTKVLVADRLATQTANVGEGVLTWTSAFTQVAVANADQFDTIGPGSDFVGMAWRLSPSASSWPTAAANFSQFDVQFSRSNNAPGSLSKTIAFNVGPDAVTVRSGALSFVVGSFPSRGSEPIAPFGAEIGFTSPYHYRGGPLLSVIRHSGQTSGSPGMMDGLGAFSAGYNADAQGWQQNSAAATTANSTSSYLATMYSVDAGTGSPLDQTSPVPGGFSWGISRTIQTVLSPSELKYIPVGSVIDSLWLRQISSGVAAYPIADVVASSVELSLSSSPKMPAAMGTLFASNEGADKVAVYSGPLRVAAGTFPPGSDGNYGKLVQFQKSFVYKGGPLCITIRHTGLTLGGFDAVQGTTSTNRTIFDNSGPGSAVGSFYGAGYSGSAMKLGYIPSVMTPNSIATVEGNAGWSMPQASAYSVQTIIPASQLRRVTVGSVITGISLRSDTTFGTASFPLADTTLAQFDVSVGPATRGPLLISTTFANNVGAGEVLARSGAITVPANAYPTSGTAGVPSENAWYIPFTRVYRYTGGDLCVTIRGQGAVGNSSAIFDGQGVTPQADGGSIWSYATSTATTGQTWGPIGIRLAFTPRAFCRADLNNDGLVDDADFSIFVVAYDMLECSNPAMPQGCPADLNFDGSVDDADFSVFIVSYNDLVCP